jgi:hypothetical protein
MMGASGDAFMFSNDLAYLITFLPALLLLFCFTLKWIVSPSVQDWNEQESANTVKNEREQPQGV